MTSFDGPRSQVFDALTKPEPIKQLVARTAGLVDEGLREQVCESI
jgi:uncharacterized protein YndB with AHSA1/START domain